MDTTAAEFSGDSYGKLGLLPCLQIVQNMLRVH